MDDLADNAKSLVEKFGASAAGGLLTGISLIGSLFTTSVLALLLTFFFLRDSDRAAGLAHSLAPRGTGALVEAMGRRAFEAVEGFMRGTTVIALIDALCITVGLLILRVPGAAGLGALVFVGAYIPYLGAFLSGAVAVLVALADRGFVIALWALGVVIAVQVLEGHVLQCGHPEPHGPDAPRHDLDRSDRGRERRGHPGHAARGAALRGGVRRDR